MIPLTADGKGHFLVNVLINNKVSASLIVDTGSPLMVLTASFARKLGLDLKQADKGTVELLNGKHQAAAVSLGQVALGGAHAQDVGAALLMEDVDIPINDGLLGLSFLGKFHYTLDEGGQRLILRKS